MDELPYIDKEASYAIDCGILVSSGLRANAPVSLPIPAHAQPWPGHSTSLLPDLHPCLAR